jgi:HSP20 family protein
VAGSFVKYLQTRVLVLRRHRTPVEAAAWPIARNSKGNIRAQYRCSDVNLLMEITIMRSLLPSLWSERPLADPFADMRRELDTMLSRSSRTWPSLEVGAAMPAVNVAETDDSVEITAELPGVDQKDISIDVDGNRLVISGEKKAETKKEDKNWRVVERSYGSFQRTLVLPFEPRTDACDAQFDNGVLRLKIAKPQVTSQESRKIQIKSGGQQGPKTIEGEKQPQSKGEKAA